MNICRKCGEKFKTKVTIGNRKRNIQNRKYCLSCSPFGLHNTIKIHIDNSNMNMECELCKRKNTQSRIRGNICDICRGSIRRIKIKKELIEYKGGKCKQCGYDKYKENPGAFCFHHRIAKEKKYTISSSKLSFEKIKEESDKCDLLCVRCHSNVHDAKNRLEKPFLYK